jgi:TusA-related sulfurtransferase
MAHRSAPAGRTDATGDVLDITAETCPMTFVRVKLAVEKMHPGEILEVRLRGHEPLRNVPRSLTEHGHTVLDLTPEGAGEPGPLTPWRLRVRKEAAKKA